MMSTSSDMSEVEQLIADHPSANGLVIILTNDYNDSSILRIKLNPLEECHNDGEEMKKTFSDIFRFACLWKKNSRAIQIIRVIAQMSRCEYPPSYKCLVIVFSGHGKENVLYGCDGKEVEIEGELIGPLQPSELPTMRTIPKLFFIDACRGKMTMIPAVKSKGLHDGVEKGGYFIAYSTTLGYRSYTRGEKSKWMPMVAQRLRSSHLSVQDIVAEITKELREDMTDMQCPEYVGQCQPVYLHRLDTAEDKESVINEPTQHYLDTAEDKESVINEPTQHNLHRLDTADQSIEDKESVINEPTQHYLHRLVTAEDKESITNERTHHYLHRLDTADQSIEDKESVTYEPSHHYRHYSGIIAAATVAVISILLLGLWQISSPINTATVTNSSSTNSSSTNGSSTILSISELMDAMPRSINNTSHFCECLELSASQCAEILSHHTSPEDQTTEMMKQWWWSYERVDRTWQKIVNSLTCNKRYKEAVLLAKNRGGNTWYKLVYKSPTPPYMYISVLSMMREVANGTHLPHPQPSPTTI